MRKRLVIGAIVVVIGVAAGHFLSPPRKGTVEHHIQKYEEASQVGPIGRWIQFHTPALRGLYYAAKSKRKEFHRNALLESGYLAKREFVLSDGESGALDVLGKTRFDLFTNWGKDSVGAPAVSLDAKAKRLKVVARSSDIAKWEAAIRQADVPETK